LAVWSSVISFALDYLRSTCLASDLQQTPTWSKLSPDTYFLCAGIQTLVLRWDKCLNVSCDYVEVWYVPSATQVSCLGYNEFRINMYSF
jgi:hypothetical protein